MVNNTTAEYTDARHTTAEHILVLSSYDVFDAFLSVFSTTDNSTPRNKNFSSSVIWITTGLRRDCCKYRVTKKGPNGLNASKQKRGLAQCKYTRVSFLPGPSTTHQNLDDG